MKLHTDGQTIHTVRSFEPGRLSVGDTAHVDPLIISAEKILSPWRPVDPRDISLADLEPALAMDPEILILGTGLRQRFLDPKIMQAVLQKGVGLEVMDTGAACRTFNVLLSEYRHVVGAFLLR